MSMQYTQSEYLALLYAGDGSDIYSKSIATTLRQAHKKDPEAFLICRPVNRPPIGEQQPILGCQVPADLLVQAEDATDLRLDEIDDKTLYRAFVDAIEEEIVG